MIHETHDPFCKCPGGYVPYKQYPPPPPQERVERWLKRVYVNSAFMRDNGNCRTELKLKAGIARALDLPDANVVIDSDGNLWHASQEKPLAVYVHGK